MPDQASPVLLPVTSEGDACNKEKRQKSKARDGAICKNDKRDKSGPVVDDRIGDETDIEK